MSSVPIFVYSDLFTPSASGVGSANPLSPDAGTWMAALLYVAAKEGLPTTSWQSGGPELSIFQSMAVKFAEVDANISVMNQGGFLDWAATGTVTFVNSNGDTVVQPVTPDPSIPSQNPTGAPGWLDVLGVNVYDVERLQATFAANLLAIANTTGSPIGPFAAGTYHVANPTTGATYANLDSLTVPSSQLAGSAGVVSNVAGTSPVTVTTTAPHGLATGNVAYVTGLIGTTLSRAFAAITVTSATEFQLVGVTATGSWSSGGTVYLCTTSQFQADAIGPNSTSAPYAISETITQNNGVVCANTLPFVGSAWESNTAYAARCRLSLASKSPNGAANSYAYFALTAQALLAAQVPAVSLDGGAITDVLVNGNPQTGVVNVVLANAGAASLTLGDSVVEGATHLAVVTAAANAGQVQLEVPSTTGLNNNDWATVSGVIGTVEANGTWQITVDDPTHITLQGTTFANTYVGGGQVEAGDLGQVDNLLQQTCTPDDTTLITQSATAFPITIVATVVIPASQATNYLAAATTAVTNYVSSVPIGGTIVPPSSSGVLDWGAVNALLFQAGVVGANPSYVRAVPVLTLNGGLTGLDLAYPTAVAKGVVASLAITLVRV